MFIVSESQALWRDWRIPKSSALLLLPLGLGEAQRDSPALHHIHTGPLTGLESKYLHSRYTPKTRTIWLCWDKNADLLFQTVPRSSHVTLHWKPPLPLMRIPLLSQALRKMESMELFVIVFCFYLVGWMGAGCLCWPDFSRDGIGGSVRRGGNLQPPGAGRPAL